MASADPGGPDRPPPLGPWLALCAGLALWIDLGSLHRLHHADSLLPTLMSLVRWEPYFWEQDRFGMLVPLLALPLAHPLANLLFQDFLDVALGLSAFVLLARYSLRDATYPAAAALACGAFLTLAPPPYRFSFLVDACYGTWLVPAVGGLIFLERDRGPVRAGRRVAGWSLIALAHWLSIATTAYLGPFVLFRAVLARRSGARGAVAEGVESLLALGFGVAVGLGLMRLSPYHGTEFGGLPPSRWAWCLGNLLRVTAEDLAPWGFPVLMAASAVVGVAVARRVGAPIRGAAVAATALGASALVTTLFLGTRSWAVANDFPSRYLSPPVVLIAVGLAGLAVSPLRAGFAPSGRAAVRFGPAVVLTLAALAGYGWPSLRGVRRDLDAAIGAHTADVLDSGCTHVTGYYWNVWPIVYHARLTAFERGEPRPIWGVSHRCEPTRDLWMSVPAESAKVALPLGDPEGRAWLRAYQLPPFAEVERRPTIRVLRPASVVPGVSPTVPSR